MPIQRDGFPPETTRFLRAVRENNNREWFEDHRDIYECAYVAPAKEFVSAAGDLLSAWRPDIQAEPRILGSVFRITKDTRRTHPDGPYKDHIDFWFWEGERRKAASAYFLRLSPDFVGIGGGKHTFTPEQRARFRAATEKDGTGEELVRIVERIEARGFTLGGGTAGSRRAGVSTGRRAELHRHRSLHVHHDEPADIINDGPALFAACERVWGCITPLHAWLIDNVQ